MNRQLQFEPDDVRKQLVLERPALLFRLANGIELVETNEPSPSPAPLVYLCAGEGVLVFRHAARSNSLLVSNVAARLETVHVTMGNAETVVRGALAANGAAGASVVAGPVFAVPRAPVLRRGIVLITETNAAVLNRFYPAVVDELRYCQPCVAWVVEGDAVSICRTVRSAPQMLEAGVDTVESFRGRGYAVAVVSIWANLVHDRKRIPCYSTAWTNAGSLGVARKLGMYQFATEVSVY